MTDWDARFMTLAAHVARWSKDPSTQVGAVVVNDKQQVLGMGYNGFPRGVHDIHARYQDRQVKLLFVAHAERNALDNTFTSSEGATLYSTLFPCTDCTKGIIQRGIKRVVTTKASETQYQRFNCDISAIMFEEAGVELVVV